MLRSQHRFITIKRTCSGTACTHTHGRTPVGKGHDPWDMGGANGRGHPGMRANWVRLRARPGGAGVREGRSPRGSFCPNGVRSKAARLPERLQGLYAGACAARAVQRVVGGGGAMLPAGARDGSRRVQVRVGVRAAARARGLARLSVTLMAFKNACSGACLGVRAGASVCWRPGVG